MQLEVREQTRLPFRRLLSICLDSIRYRLLRSMVTVFIIVVAIAFLATIIVEGQLGRAARDTVTDRTAHLTAYSRFLRDVSQTPSAGQLVDQAAAARPGTATWANFRRWGGFDDDAMQAFADHCRQVRRYARFFDRIPVGRRVLLVDQATGLEIFDALADPDRRAAFEQALAPMKSLRLPGGGLPAFKEFLDAWPDRRAELDRVRRQCRAAQDAIAASCRPDGLRAVLARRLADGTAEAFFAGLADLGYEVAPDAVPDILTGIAYQTNLDWAIGYLNQPGIRRGWNSQFNETFGPLKALVACAATPSRVDWIESILARDHAAEGFDRARFLDIAAAAAHRQELLDAEQTLIARYGQGDDKQTQAYWLVFVSFLVCVVGIANAMLMSVLERFKEIATMKCLGARNETIAFLFITESIMMGIVGGVIGIAGGLLIALLRQSISYGSLIFSRFPLDTVCAGVLVCFGCSLLLTAFAAVYPARVASKMPPMEAMRVD